MPKLSLIVQRLISDYISYGRVVAMVAVVVVKLQKKIVMGRLLGGLKLCGAGA